MMRGQKDIWLYRKIFFGTSAQAFFDYVLKFNQSLLIMTGHLPKLSTCPQSCPSPWPLNKCDSFFLYIAYPTISPPLWIPNFPIYSAFKMEDEKSQGSDVTIVIEPGASAKEGGSEEGAPGGPPLGFFERLRREKEKAQVEKDIRRANDEKRGLRSYTVIVPVTLLLMAGADERLTVIRGL